MFEFVNGMFYGAFRKYSCSSYHDFNGFVTDGDCIVNPSTLTSAFGQDTIFSFFKERLDLLESMSEFVAQLKSASEAEVSETVTTYLR